MERYQAIDLISQSDFIPECYESMTPEEKIPIFITLLPRQELKKYATTEDLLDFWYELRGNNQIVGACLKARFSGEDDPISHWKDVGDNDNDKLGELYHNFVWCNVDVFQALWALVQMSAKEVLKKFKSKYKSIDPPSGAYDLFMQIVGNGRDNEFKSALYFKKVSVAETAEIWKLIRKAAWWKLTPEEVQKLNQLTKFYPKNFWLEFTFAVAKRSEDSQVANKLADYRTQVGRLADAHTAIISNARKGRIDLKLRSHEWQDRQRVYTNPRRS